MPHLPTIPIRQKLRLMTMIVTGVALLLTCGSFVWFGVAWFKRQTEYELKTLADVIGDSSSAALEFAEIAESNTQSLMDSLVANPNIVAGCIYGSDDKVLGRYSAKNSGVSPPTHPPTGPSALEYVKTISGSNGERLGTLYLQSDPRRQRRFLWTCTSVVGGSLIFAWIVAFLFAARLQ